MRAALAAISARRCADVGDTPYATLDAADSHAAAAAATRYNMLRRPPR